MRTVIVSILLSSTLWGTMLSFETLRAEFNQSVTTDSAQSLRYSGTLYLKQPDRALWIYTTPIKKSIYIQGEAVTIVEPELLQATHLRQATAQNILELFEQSKAIAPGQRQAVFNDTVVEIRHDARFITHLHYIDEFEHNVSIHFSEPEINLWLEPGFFQPEIPKGFDQFKTR